MKGNETEMRPETEYTKFIGQSLQESAEIANHNFGKVSAVSTKETDNN